MPKVSVIIPAYNAMEYLPETVESVLNQTFEDFEIVVVDDGSADNVRGWAENVEDERVRLISQHNQGPSIARNTGIDSAKGEYIAFLDSDDLWEPTKLSKQVDLLDKRPEVGLVYTWIIQTDRQGNSTGRLFKFYQEGKVWEKMLLRNFVACGSTPMIRHKCFDEVGGFDPNLFGPEDNDMWLRIASKYEFAVIKEPLVYYRQLNTSVSRNLGKMEKSWRIMHDKALSNAPDYLTPDDLQRLEKESYSLKYIYLAWRALQSADKNYELASTYCQKALSYDSKVLFSSNFVRLNVVIFLMRTLGSDRFQNFQDVIYRLRGSIRRVN